MVKAILLLLVSNYALALESRDLTISKYLKENQNKSAGNVEKIQKPTKKYFSESVRVPQTYKGINIYGSELVFHYDKLGNVEHISGRRSSIGEFNVDRKISKTRAIEIVQKELLDFALESIELNVYPAKNKNYLIWVLEEKNTQGRKNTVFLDAKSGNILEVHNNIHSMKGTGHGVNGHKRSLYTSKDNEGSGDYVLRYIKEFKVETRSMKHARLGPFNSSFNLKGRRVRSRDNFFKAPEAVDAHYFTSEFLKVLKSDFNRDSFDGKGSVVRSFVSVSPQLLSGAYVNAYWDGKAMYYGDGDGVTAKQLSGALDVVAHEITHGITQNSSNLVYRNESGALNESFSDIMGTYAEYKIDRENFDWMLGEDVWTPNREGDALRYMNDPTKDKDRKMSASFGLLGKIINTSGGGGGSSSTFYSRDFYPDRYKGSADAGGVHLNSGISNLAFQLLTDGGVHPRSKTKMKVNGIGIEKAAQIFFNAFTKSLVRTSKFIDARKETIFWAKKLYGAEVAEYTANAWSAVGVK